MRLTKQRLDALNASLSVDDILYEKFRRLNADLQKREARFEARRQIAGVYRNDGKIRIAMQVVGVFEGANGLVVEVR